MRQKTRTVYVYFVVTMVDPNRVQPSPLIRVRYISIYLPGAPSVLKGSRTASQLCTHHACRYYYPGVISRSDRRGDHSDDDNNLFGTS